MPESQPQGFAERWHARLKGTQEERLMTPASRLRGGMAKGESQISTCMMFVPMHRFCTSVKSQYDQTHLKMVSSSALFCSYSNNPALPSIRLTLF